MDEGFKDIFDEFEKKEAPEKSETTEEKDEAKQESIAKDEQPKTATPAKKSLLDDFGADDTASIPGIEDITTLPEPFDPRDPEDDEPGPEQPTLIAKYSPTTTPTTTSTTSDEKWDFSEDKTSGKEVWVIYGLKGHGKTRIALGFLETIVGFSFDQKTAPIKENSFNGDPRITVHNAVKYMDYSSPQAELESSERTFRFIMALLDNIEKKEKKPDWILIDAIDIYTVIAEMTMRYRNGLQPYQGIANRNLWKERRLYIRQIEHKSLAVANKGIIYTAFTDQHEIIQDGEFIIKEDIPRWINVIMYGTDYVIKAYQINDEKGKHFMIHVDSSKNDNRIKTGATIDVTNSGIPLQTV